MSDFLRKIKILDSMTIELDIHKSDFIKKFRQNVDASDLSFSDSFFEGLTSSPNEYKGNIDERNFNIRRRRKMFDTNKNFAVANGNLTEQLDKLVIKTDINGFHKGMKFFYMAIIVFYIIFIFGFSATMFFNEGTGFMPFAVLPFILLHACLMLGIPYFMMKRGVKRMKYELERDFHFWTK